MNAQTSLFTDSQLLRVDVFDADAHCDGPSVLAGTPAPTLTRTFLSNQPLTLDIPPGRHALVLTGYSDAAGTVLIASQCLEAEFKPGSRPCLTIELMAATNVDFSSLPDLSSPPDLSCEPPFNTVSHCGSCSNVCAAPRQCCGSVCETEHNNGLMGKFYDCAALNTYNMTEATAAANAYSLPSAMIFGDTSTCVDGTALICKYNGTTCACWGYTGTGTSMGAGRVLEKALPCGCPTGAQPAWH